MIADDCEVCLSIKPAIVFPKCRKFEGFVRNLNKIR